MCVGFTRQVIRQANIAAIFLNTIEQTSGIVKTPFNTDCKYVLNGVFEVNWNMQSLAFI